MKLANLSRGSAAEITKLINQNSENIDSGAVVISKTVNIQDEIRKAVITISDEIKSINDYIDDQNHQIQEISNEIPIVAEASNTSQTEVNNLVSKSQ